MLLLGCLEEDEVAGNAADADGPGGMYHGREVMVSKKEARLKRREEDVPWQGRVKRVHQLYLYLVRRCVRVCSKVKVCQTVSLIFRGYRLRLVARQGTHVMSFAACSDS